ncbi:uncharacterized protein LOC107805825 isoform X2 [Nicotiana tabacum]|uniref:Uncharacterized protein LOC107805825 isoform X2 n=1 Tax=Nicotiana tabacum TaxID=4097 RepID=A0A1S4B8Z3_TOBAC
MNQPNPTPFQFPVARQDSRLKQGQNSTVDKGNLVNKAGGPKAKKGKPFPLSYPLGQKIIPFSIFKSTKTDTCKIQKQKFHKEMAVSLGVFSTFSAVETASFIKSSSSSSSSFRLVGNLPSVRIATFAASSKPATTEPKKREPRGIMKPRRVSPEMQTFLGGLPEIPRTQALKFIWAHIKQHNLQDPEDKKVIICDEKLKNIFGGRDRVGFLEIAGLMALKF